MELSQHPNSINCGHIFVDGVSSPGQAILERLGKPLGLGFNSHSMASICPRSLIMAWYLAVQHDMSLHSDDRVVLSLAPRVELGIAEEVHALGRV